MHLLPLTRHKHYEEMRGLVNVDGVPAFTTMDCLFIAYGPGHNGRRRRWEKQTKRTVKWSVADGLEVTVETARLPERR